MKKQFLEAGKIVAPHGIKGEVRVQSWCDDGILTTLDELYFENGKEKIIAEASRPHKNVVIIKFEGINDMDSAQSLRGRILYLNRKDLKLDKDAYFIQDLFGCKVIDFNDTSVEYGIVKDITQTGANDVYHILTADNKLLLAPAIDEVVRAIDLENNRILITPLKGLFDDED